jgi:tRNA (guanine37-N1)-methyltransferase
MDPIALKTPGIALPKQKTEEALGVLRKMDLQLQGFEFRRADATIMIPLVRKPSMQEQAAIRSRLGNFQIQEAEFDPIISRENKLRDAVKTQIPTNLISMLPRSYDIIGDIAVLELPSALEPYSAEIGNGIIRVNPHVQSVFRKSGDVAGTFRTRKLQAIAGSGNTETVHHEFSCSYSLDVATVYFNPRLSHERMRVARQVWQSEVVIDMFAGVGPYSVLIAKSQPSSKVYSIDINPEAIKYLKENIFANGVADRVVPILGDARLLSAARLRGLADRVIMNLPSEAERYLDAALQILKPEGGLVHFYQFAQRQTSSGTIKDAFRASVEAEAREVESFKFCNPIREVAPGKLQVAIDAVVK